MPLFKKNQNHLGIDIGTSSIKLVEFVSDAGRPRLVTYGYIEQSVDLIKSDTPEMRNRLVGLIQQLLKSAGATADRAVAALPSFAVFTSIISLPQMGEKDLLAAIRWEAKKFVPMPLEEMILDWRIIKEPEKKAAPAVAGQESQANPAQTVVSTGAQPKDRKILLTAAPKGLVQRYIDIFRMMNLRLTSLETEAFALERSLIGNDPSPVLVIDIGAMATDMSVITHGIPILNRSIDVGGDTFTKAIMRSLSIDQTRAEQFKRDFGLSPGGEGANQIPQALELVVASIINEVRYCLNLYQGQAETGKVEKILLAGGSAFLNGLADYISRMLNLKVFIGDPWARVVYPTDLEPVLKEIGPRFAVAIGLAMRDIL